jgi:YVTN family beta-propeller protein
MTDATLIADIPVGNSPSSIAINSDTNMIYVTNRDSGTVSVIDGNTNNLTAGVIFKADPSKGKIKCNNQDISNNYVRFAVGTKLTCKANPNVESVFSWLDLNEMIYRTLFTTHYNKIVFDSWSGNEINSTLNPIDFTVSHYGTTLTANL